MTMKKWASIEAIRGFNFYKENYIHDIPFFLNFYKKKLFFTLKHIFSEFVTFLYK
jgi:hypothetical protein